MSNRHYILFFLAGSLLLLPVASYYGMSWKEKYAKFIKDDTVQKFMPVGVLALGLAVGGLYYYLRANTPFEVIGEIQEVPVSQLQVYGQFSLGGGGNASCGYHTLLRGMQLINAKAYGMSNDNLKKILLGTKSIETYFNNWSPLGRWRQAIIDRRKSLNVKDLRNGDWLDDGELDFLWENQDILSKQNESSGHYGFTAIPDIKMIGRKSKEFSLNEKHERIFDEQGNPIEVDVDADVIMPPLRTVLKEKAEKKVEYFHLLAIGTMEEGEGYERTEGHFYALVLHQEPDGARHYFVMDSMGTSRLNDDRVVKLITAIEAKDVEEYEVI